MSAMGIYMMFHDISQNAWSGGYIAGTSIGKLALGVCVKDEGNL